MAEFGGLAREDIQGQPGAGERTVACDLPVDIQHLAGDQHSILVDQDGVLPPHLGIAAAISLISVSL